VNKLIAIHLTDSRCVRSVFPVPVPIFNELITTQKFAKCKVMHKIRVAFGLFILPLALLETGIEIEALTQHYHYHRSDALIGIHIAQAAWNSQ